MPVQQEPRRDLGQGAVRQNAQRIPCGLQPVRAKHGVDGEERQPIGERCGRQCPSGSHCWRNTPIPGINHGIGHKPRQQGHAVPGPHAAAQQPPKIKALLVFYTRRQWICRPVLGLQERNSVLTNVMAINVRPSM